MCGISGLFAIRNSKLIPYIKPMNDLIKHRGPNDEGYVAFRKHQTPLYLKGDDSTNHADKTEHINNTNQAASVQACLGHRRLSIVDLSAVAHQPFSTQDLRYTIIFNGEIYNYIELRETLLSRGHHFRTKSDTEVLLSAYLDWGVDFLHRLNGMFAFVIYDNQTSEVFIARDRFGVKPLYYWISKAGFLALGSEIKQFTVLPGWEGKANHQAIYDFLVWSVADHSQYTMFADVHQLCAGHFAKFKLGAEFTGQFKSIQWYKLGHNISTNSSTTFDKVKDLLFDAVRIRTRADVPVGTCLSGGIDSSAIVCTLNEILKKESISSTHNTFSACTHEKEFSEESHIKKVLDVTDVESHFVYLDPKQLQKDFAKLTWHQDEPFYSTSIFAEWSLYELVSKTQIKVTLDGHGADELFAGYHLFYPVYFQEMLRKGQFGKLIKNYIKVKELHGYNALLLLRAAISCLPNKLRQIASFQALKYFRGRRHLNLDTFTSINKRNAFYTSAGNSLSIQSERCLTASSLPIQLHWADRDSMARGIESRAPYLDYRLIEHIYSLSNEYKISDGWTKYALRNAIKDYVPKDIAFRVDKIGFEAPESAWAKTTLRKPFQNWLEQVISNSNGLVNNSVLKWFDAMCQNKTRYDNFIWRLISLGQWIDTFKVKM